MKKYFKKLSIMFVMSLVLMLGCCVSAFADDNFEVGKTNFNNTAENTAKVGNQLTAPEIGWKRYDDSNSLLVYTDGGHEEDISINRNYAGNINYWKSTRSGLTRSGSNNTAELKFCFYGDAFRIISDEYHTCRTNKINVKIDGNNENVDLVDNTNVLLDPQIVQYDSSNKNLSLGKHTVIITPEYVSGGRGFCVDAIDIKNGYLVPYNESITLDKSSMELKVNDSAQLTETTTPAGAQVTWKSSDESIATVLNGKVTGVKEGTCTITATTVDGATATCAVTVTPKGTDPNPEPTDTDKIVNIAHAKGDNTNNPGGDVIIIFHGAADTTLSVVKTADVKEVWVGDTVTYTIVVTNTGTKTAKAVVVNDPAPNHIDFNVNAVTTTQGKVDSSSTAKNIVVNVGDIPPAGTVTIRIPATVIE